MTLSSLWNYQINSSDKDDFNIRVGTVPWDWFPVSQAVEAAHQPEPKPQRSYIIVNNFNQHEGAPQGSVISTFVNSSSQRFCQTGYPSIKCLLYVDDFAIWIADSSPAQVARILQSALNTLLAYMEARGFTVSSEKTSNNFY